jgi:hypothetical protein
MARKSALSCTCLLRFRAGAQRCEGAAISAGRMDLLRTGMQRSVVVAAGGSRVLVNVLGVREGTRRNSVFGRPIVVVATVLLAPKAESPGRIETDRAGARRRSSVTLATSASAAAKKRANVRARLEASRAECAMVSASQRSSAAPRTACRVFVISLRRRIA